jgi:hypothetical protein
MKTQLRKKARYRMSEVEIIANRDGVKTVTALISSGANQIETLRFIKIISPAIERLHLAARKQERKVSSDS